MSESCNNDKEMYKKSVIQMHVQSCCFANPKPIGFFAILVAVAAVVAWAPVLYSLAAHNNISVGNLAGLFVCQKYVAMKLSSFGWAAPNIVKLHLSFAYITAWDIYHKPMVPFTELRMVTAWSVRVCQHREELLSQVTPSHLALSYVAQTFMVNVCHPKCKHSHTAMNTLNMNSLK